MLLFILEFTVKKRNNWHRHDYTEPNDGSKPVQAGTFVFVRELQNRTFAKYVGRIVGILHPSCEATNIKQHATQNTKGTSAPTVLSSSLALRGRCEETPVC